MAKDNKVMQARNLQQVSAAQRIVQILSKFGTYLFLCVMALAVLFPFIYYDVSFITIH